MKWYRLQLLILPPFAALLLALVLSLFAPRPGLAAGERLPLQSPNAVFTGTQVAPEAQPATATVMQPLLPAAFTATGTPAGTDVPVAAQSPVTPSEVPPPAGVEVVRIEPASAQPFANDGVSVPIVLRNRGETDAPSVTVALYESDASTTVDVLGRQVSGPLLAGTALIDTRRLPLAAGAEATATLVWTPTRAGPRQLIAVAGTADSASSSAGSRRQTILPVFVGFRGPILIDSGGANDIAYGPAAGYGFLGADGGLGRVCGGESYHISRQAAADGLLQYRVDGFQPGRTYHLDLTFGECDGAGRRQRVLANGAQLLGAVDLSDEQPHHYSVRLDRSLYAAGVVTITLEEAVGRPALLSALHVYDVDYREVIAGSPAEQAYPTVAANAAPRERAFGYLDGVPQTFDDAPGMALRAGSGAEELRYRFDQLDPARRYALNLTFYHRDPLTPALAIALGGWYQSPRFTVPYSQPYGVTIAIPRGAYAADGSITVSISRTDIVTGAFASEVALEEQTLGETFSSADLMLLPLDSPRAVTVGVPVTYTLLILNVGPDTAAEVVLNAPAAVVGLRLAGAAGGFCAGAAHLSCSLGEFPSGASVPVSVVITPASPGVLNIPLSIDSMAADPNSANNSVVLSSQVAAAGP